MCSEGLWGAWIVIIAASSALVTGCGGASSLAGGVPPSTTAPAARGYLAELQSEQAKLAAAERSIPSHPRTPAALSQSIALLAAAIGRLAAGLAAIRPPPAVLAAHARLLKIVREYESRLTTAAREAARPGGELRAASLLLSATNSVSGAFTSTVSEIDAKLK